MTNTDVGSDRRPIYGQHGMVSNSEVVTGSFIVADLHKIVRQPSRPPVEYCRRSGNYTDILTSWTEVLVSVIEGPMTTRDLPVLCAVAFLPQFVDIEKGLK
jgi:hypothetical protein